MKATKITMITKERSYFVFVVPFVAFLVLRGLRG